MGTKGGWVAEVGGKGSWVLGETYTGWVAGQGLAAGFHGQGKSVYMQVQQ